MCDLQKTYQVFTTTFTEMRFHYGIVVFGHRCAFDQQVGSEFRQHDSSRASITLTRHSVDQATVLHLSQRTASGSPVDSNKARDVGGLPQALIANCEKNAPDGSRQAKRFEALFQPPLLNAGR